MSFNDGWVHRCNLLLRYFPASLCLYVFQFFNSCLTVCVVCANIMTLTIFNDGSLGSLIDEERSQLRYVV